MNAFEREEQAIEDDLESGNISQKEHNEEIAALERDYRNAAIDSAQKAYDNEMQNW